MAPFRFLDLPLELQRHVLMKYYEDGYDISVRNTRPNNSVLSRTGTTFSTNLLLVSKHLQNEAVDAIRRSRNNTYRDYDDLVSAPKIRPTFLKDTVSTVCLAGTFPVVPELEYLRQRFRNVQTIDIGHITSFSNGYLNPPMMALLSQDLSAFLEGMYDSTLIKETKVYLFRAHEKASLKKLVAAGIDVVFRIGCEAFNAQPPPSMAKFGYSRGRVQCHSRLNDQGASVSKRRVTVRAAGVAPSVLKSGISTLEFLEYGA
ncbi:hypothetical protein PMZ80_007076 [Knufia obscura]|uniref:Uncharacterized protein n=2 Tax=Knufia TaxID=430999 RepID=A0AAN8EPC4_9EURO|nr:hypothetical protein PMZ80_007076 [Knufia obscura]KAK5953085.1 hypothetical protein OHC33_005653 [Knufia fluminis]